MPTSAGPYQTQNGWCIETAAKASARANTPSPIIIFEVTSTKSRAFPLLAHQVSALARHPRIAPAAPPIKPPARFDHHAGFPSEPVAKVEAVRSSSWSAPIFTVPAPVMTRFTSRRVGFDGAALPSNGNANSRQPELPLITAISPLLPSVLVKYFCSGAPGGVPGKEFHISR